jgi:hypothetical protein
MSIAFGLLVCSQVDAALRTVLRRATCVVLEVS